MNAEEVKTMHPVVLVRHFTTTFHLEFAHAGDIHQVEVGRVDELQEALDAIAHVSGIPVEQLYITTDYSVAEVELLTEETKREFCHFHVEAALRLRKTLGYTDAGFDLLVLLNGAKIRIERCQKRLEELGEKLDKE